MAVKQVIVMRTDLNMRKGKMAAQAAHASLGVFFDRMTESGADLFTIAMTPEMAAWKRGLFTKICVAIDSEDGLADVYGKSLAAGLPAKLITDAGLTEFGGVPTVTCCAIGPADDAAIDAITGHLRLL